MKALTDIRRRIEDAEARAHDAIGERDRMAGHLAELIGGFRVVVRRWAEAEQWLNRFRGRLDDEAAMGVEFISEEMLDSAFDGASNEVIGAPLHALCAGLDPDVLALIGRLDPESVAQTSPRHQTATTGGDADAS